MVERRWAVLLVSRDAAASETLIAFENVGRIYGWKVGRHSVYGVTRL